MNKKVISILAIVAIVLVGLAVYIINKKPENKIQNYTQADVAETNGIETKIVEINRSQGDDKNKPVDGKEFLIIKIEITNTTKEEKDFSSFNYKLINKDNVSSFVSTSNFNQEKQLNGGSVLPSGTRSGELLFEIPKGSKEYRLGFYEDYQKDEITYSIKLDQ